MSKAQKLVDGDTLGFIEAMGTKALDMTRRAANQTMIDNAERDFKKGVRWARVPTGMHTCGFCVMLASRGFVYRSKETAGYSAFAFNSFHRFCDCRVIPNTEDGSVEGYDPNHLYDVYLNARKTIEGYAEDKWWSMSASERFGAVSF